MNAFTSAASKPALAPHAFAYEASDIPPDMTIDEFRSQRLRDRGRQVRITLRGRLRSWAMSKIRGR